MNNSHNNNKSFSRKKKLNNKSPKHNGGKQLVMHKEPRSMPLEFIPNRKFEFRRRYSTTAAILGNLKISDLLGSLVMAASPTVGYSLLDTVKLKRIQVWSPVVTQGTVVSIIISPSTVDSGNNCYNDIRKQITDSSQAIDEVAYVNYATKVTLPSGSWHASTSVDTNLFEMQFPAGSIMDLDLVGLLNTYGGPNGFTSTLVAATVGTQYARPILTTLLPIGVNQI